jgi:hypothetical protein
MNWVIDAPNVESRLTKKNDFFFHENKILNFFFSGGAGGWGWVEDIHMIKIERRRRVGQGERSEYKK